MTISIGCIGCGNMGSALLKGFARVLTGSGASFSCFDAIPAKMEGLADLGITPRQTAAEVADSSQIVILAVKPINVSEVLGQIAPRMTDGKMLVSLAAGFGLSRLRNHLGRNPGICRCMPTTTALAGKGIFALDFDPLTVDENLKKEVEKLFGSLGMCIMLKETEFPAFSALIGAGPAYVFEMMAALAQAATTLGFTPDVAKKMLIELFAGCADLARIQHGSFMDLRNAVCSPGGLTIAGVNRLDRQGFVGLVVEAVEAAEKRAREMES